MLIELDDPVWCELRHAYGEASSVPSTIRQMYSGVNVVDEEFRGLTNALAHQGSVYTASFASFPHLVKIGVSGGRYHKVAFSIAEIILYDSLAADGTSLPSMNDRLEQSFLFGLQTGREYLSAKLTSLSSNDQDELYFLRRVALFRMRPRVTMLIDVVSQDFQCPHCRELIERPVVSLCPFPYLDLSPDVQ
jgi:hypothetical protein